MTRNDFENKYLNHNFFWIINSEQAEELQQIMLEFGFKNPTGGNSTIKMHNGFKNLVTFQPNEWNNYKYFQKVDIFLPNASYGGAVNYEQFINDYKLITS